MGGNTWERGAYSASGAIRFTGSAQESTLYFFQANSDTVACGPDSMRWCHILGAATAAGVRLPTTTGQFYSIGKMRRICHLELYGSAQQGSYQLSFFTGGSVRQQIIFTTGFTPAWVSHNECDSVKVRSLTGTGNLNYVMW